MVLRKLRQLQDLGHEIIFLIGDFTGMIGDPTGKNKTRKTLTREEVLKNAETYKKQIFKVLDQEKTVIRFNSEWHLNMPFKEVLGITSRYTLARVLERDDFTKRFKNNDPITITELLYPLVQGYDSVALEADVEVGGSDQLFNLLVGRNLQKEYQQPSQVVLTFPLLEGLDGKNKMSKSLNNYIGFNDQPQDMFGKVMSIPDEIMLKYFKLVLDYEDDRLAEIEKSMEQGENPRNLKLILAESILKIFYNAEMAQAAREEFVNIFSKGKIPQDLVSLEIKPILDQADKVSLLEVVMATQLFKSKGEARRLISSGGVKLNEKKMINANEELFLPDLQGLLSQGEGEEKLILKVGKKKLLPD